MNIETSAASGVIYAQGSRFGGHALYVKDQKLKYVYNWVGEFEQIVESTVNVPTGECVLSAVFEKEGDGDAHRGDADLYIGDDKVGEAKIKTQPGKFSLAGEGLNVGKEGAEPVTDDYPGKYPWAFTGGTSTRSPLTSRASPGSTSRRKSSPRSPATEATRWPPPRLFRDRKAGDQIAPPDLVCIAPMR